VSVYLQYPKLFAVIGTAYGAGALDAAGNLYSAILLLATTAASFDGVEDGAEVPAGFDFNHIGTIGILPAGDTETRPINQAVTYLLRSR
jgi:hypothetical protein